MMGLAPLQPPQPWGTHRHLEQPYSTSHRFPSTMQSVRLGSMQAEQFFASTEAQQNACCRVHMPHAALKMRTSKQPCCIHMQTLLLPPVAETCRKAIRPLNVSV